MDSTQTITYSIVNDYTDLFDVDGTNGRISTKQPLNREQQSSYILRIRAMDNGSPSLSSTAQVSLLKTNFTFKLLFLTQGNSCSTG